MQAMTLFYPLPGQVINQGGDGVVTRRDMRYPASVAVKTYKVDGNRMPHLCDRETYFLMRIRETGSTARSRFVAIFPDLLLSPQRHITMEYCPGGSLYQVKKLAVHEGRHLTEDFIWEIFYQLIDALNFLRTGNPFPGGVRTEWKPIVHRDLKPENVLMRADRTIAICDFAHAYEHAPTGVSINTWSAPLGTPTWWAPEQVPQGPTGKAAPTFDTDTWGAGAIVHFLALGRAPVAHAKDVCYPNDWRLSRAFAARIPRAPTFIDGPSTGTELNSTARRPLGHEPKAPDYNFFYSPALNAKMMRCLAYNSHRRTTPVDLLREWPNVRVAVPPKASKNLSRPSPMHEYVRERDRSALPGLRTMEWVHDPLGRPYRHRFQTLEVCAWNAEAMQKQADRRMRQAWVRWGKGRRHSAGEWEGYKLGGPGTMNATFGLFHNEKLLGWIKEDLKHGPMHGFDGRWQYGPWFRLKPWPTRDQFDVGAWMERHDLRTVYGPKINEDWMEPKEWERGLVTPWPTGRDTIANWYAPLRRVQVVMPKIFPPPARRTSIQKATDKRKADEEQCLTFPGDQNYHIRTATPPSKRRRSSILSPGQKNEAEASRLRDPPAPSPVYRRLGRRLSRRSTTAERSTVRQFRELPHHPYSGTSGSADLKLPVSPTEPRPINAVFESKPLPERPHGPPTFTSDSHTLLPEITNMDSATAGNRTLARIVKRRDVSVPSTPERGRSITRKVAGSPVPGDGAGSPMTTSPWPITPAGKVAGPPDIAGSPLCISPDKLTLPSSRSSDTRRRGLSKDKDFMVMSRRLAQVGGIWHPTADPVDPNPAGGYEADASDNNSDSTTPRSPRSGQRPPKPRKPPALGSPFSTPPPRQQPQQPSKPQPLGSPFSTPPPKQQQEQPTKPQPLASPFTTTPPRQQPQEPPNPKRHSFNSTPLSVIATHQWARKMQQSALFSPATTSDQAEFIHDTSGSSPVPGRSSQEASTWYLARRVPSPANVVASIEGDSSSQDEVLEWRRARRESGAPSPSPLDEPNELALSSEEDEEDGGVAVKWEGEEDGCVRLVEWREGMDKGKGRAVEGEGVEERKDSHV